MALVVSAATNIQAQTAQAHRSIVGNYATGYENGKSAARQGVLTSSCPLDFWNNMSYCTGYHIGYAQVKNAKHCATITE